MKQRFIRTKGLYNDFEAKYMAFCNAMDAANAAVDQYNAEALEYRAGYDEELEKAEAKLQEIILKQSEIDRKVSRLRADWAAAAMKDEDVSAIDAEIEKLMTETKILSVKRQSLEEMKISGSSEQFKKAEACSNAVADLEEAAERARVEASAAVQALLKDLRENYAGTYTLKFAFANISPDNRMDKIRSLRDDVGNVKEALDRAGEIRKKADDARRERVAFAKRLAEQERQLRISARENELINATPLRGVEVDGKIFERSYDSFAANPEYKCNGLSLRDYLEQTMPLIEADYRNGGFGPDGERY